jgi:AraC-like DNA-binding protein
LLRARALGGWFRPLDRSAAAGAAIARLEAWLQDGGHHRRSDLRLVEAAAAIEVQPELLSRWLNDRGRSFGDVLTQARLEDAARLLRDPAEARTSIEAIGLMVGFASRSGFYKAFTKQFADSPGAYRRARNCA